MTEPQERAAIAHLDFIIECGAPKSVTKGVRCTAEAVAYTEMHVIGACHHASLNSGGNIERLVCPKHLEALRAYAVRQARRHQPLPWWARWFRNPQPDCPTCGQEIAHSGHVLQVVRPLWQ